VQDEFRTPDRPVNLRWAMVARTTVTIDGAARGALSSAGRTLRFGVREPASANLNIYPTNPPPAAIDARNEGTRLLGFEVSVSAGQLQRLIVHLAPENNPTSPPAIEWLESW
jgi:hypothetical protein